MEKGFSRGLAITKIIESEGRNLLNFINSSCGFITLEEQQEVEAFVKNHDKSREEFIDVKLDDII